MRMSLSIESAHVAGTVALPDQLEEFVLEAALFCKKAQCEDKMNAERKQNLTM
jgi:hypothetical protein